jgi:hypothetical protein
MLIRGEAQIETINWNCYNTKTKRSEELRSLMGILEMKIMF